MKILLVDDSRSARQLTAAYLADMGHPAVEAADGNAALALYQQDRPDLVLLDVEMPVMDGYTLAKEIRQLDRDHWVPIIFLSGRVADEDIERGIDAGGDDYITKPVSPIVLRAKLNAMRRITDMRKRLLQMSEELQDANRALVKLSSLDGLTNILNRRSFDAALEVEWHRGLRSGKPLALILGDVDYFKRYNDTYGHDGGDNCLRAVAGALSKAARRASDLVARYGGEEFVVLMTDTSEQAAMQVAERVLDAVRNLQIPHRESKTADHVTMSLGVSVCVPTPAMVPQDLIRAADAALYQSKAEGRNRAMFQYMKNHDQEAA
jgi:diguanylate cyclase (GGDEF)-like protein